MFSNQLCGFNAWKCLLTKQFFLKAFLTSMPKCSECQQNISLYSPKIDVNVNCQRAIIFSGTHSSVWLYSMWTDTCLNVDSQQSEHFVRSERLHLKQIWHWRCRLRSPASRWVGCLFSPSSSFYTQTDTNTHTLWSSLYWRHSITSIILESLCLSAPPVLSGSSRSLNSTVCILQIK